MWGGGGGGGGGGDLVGTKPKKILQKRFKEQRSNLISVLNVDEVKSN